MGSVKRKTCVLFGGVLFIIASTKHFEPGWKIAQPELEVGDLQHKLRVTQASMRALHNTYLGNAT